jgi:hypothetical protein
MFSGMNSFQTYNRPHVRVTTGKLWQDMLQYELLHVTFYLRMAHNEEAQRSCHVKSTVSLRSRGISAGKWEWMMNAMYIKDWVGTHDRKIVLMNPRIGINVVLFRLLTREKRKVVAEETGVAKFSYSSEEDCEPRCIDRQYLNCIVPTNKRTKSTGSCSQSSFFVGVNDNWGNTNDDTSDSKCGLRSAQVDFGLTLSSRTLNTTYVQCGKKYIPFSEKLEDMVLTFIG